eukprot:Plantae.Rhodophyta-Palmaria_palmata.ctg23364.p1 GENE.Plantae.Rhodophyta-Palmaria_palmata.ctg23364~~Plantae.Rhodophyta-Palmaria_palmata.ctg23364.p1  ORF type:complete len:154 (-),score=39.04 Plantae.Rhodophyta-Palmaria_palmata.ctg23364:154-615(-)
MSLSNRGLSGEKVDECRQAFNVFDKNGDGDISLNELGSVLRSLGQKPTKKSVRLMIKKVDADGSGTIDFDEFLTLMAAKLKHQDLRSEMLKSFKLFDKDGSGKISANELEAVLRGFGQSLTPEEIEDTLREADKNNDGEIDIQEFIEMMGFDN